MSFWSPRPGPRQALVAVAIVALLAAAPLLLGATDTAPAPDTPDAAASLGADAGAVPLPGLAPLPGAPAAPMASDAARDVTFTLVRAESDFTKEVYKYGDLAQTRNLVDVENQTTVWDTALGHHIRFWVRIDAGDQPLDCSDRFVPEAYIDTLGGRLYGFSNGTIDTTPPSGPPTCTSGPPGVRLFNLTFDLDGAPPTASGALLQPLLDGVHTVVFNLYHQVTPSPQNPAGQGPLAGQYLIPFTVANPQTSLPTPFGAFPENVLRMFNDVGAYLGSADRFAMPLDVLGRNEETTLSIVFPGLVPAGTQWERIDHYALRTGPGLENPVQVPPTIGGMTPIDEVVDKTDDLDDKATADVERIPHSLDNDTVPPSGTVSRTLRGSEFALINDPVSGLQHTPLHVVAVHIPASADSLVTGVSSFVLPVSDHDFPVRGIEIGTLGPVNETGTTRITFQDPTMESGGESGTDAGDLFALRPNLGTVITQTKIMREPGAKWMEGEFSHLDFQAVAAYRMLAMVYGGNDEFLGLAVADRGIDLTGTGLRLVEGRSGEIRLTIQNLGTDFDTVADEEPFRLTVHLQGEGFPDGTTYTGREEGIPEGGSRSLRVPVGADRPGTFSINFTATAGELEASRPLAINVISKERAAEENRKWYDIPGPEISFALIALLGVIAVAARRRDRAA